ncbi:hypothetical protein M0R45_028474 [Rubus argutus]|uniref:Uncharacterized protein n=1 Tax=Rubus argutus TaxID=59490 RepID=A0AAW1W7C4_RUBAR
MERRRGVSAGQLEELHLQLKVAMVAWRRRGCERERRCELKQSTYVAEKREAGRACKSISMGQIELD